MKNILLATILCALMSCSSQKRLETDNVPFEIGQSSFQKWAGGMEESGSGAELRIIISETLANTSFEKIYFRGRAFDCELKTENDISVIVASFKRAETTNDLIDKDGAKIQEAFDLQADQAIIAFKKGTEKLKYAKVNGIKEKAPVLYRALPKMN